MKISEGTLVKTHLDEFNLVIIDLKNVDIKVEDKDQALIVLYSLHHPTRLSWILCCMERRVFPSMTLAVH